MLQKRPFSIIMSLILICTMHMQTFGRGDDPANLRGASQDKVTPTAARFPSIPLDELDRIDIPPIDLEAVQQEDMDRELLGLAPRYAIPNTVWITPDTDGTWEVSGDDTIMWRLRVSAPGAQSLNLGFTRYMMPPGGRLLIYAADRSSSIRPFDHGDNEDHGELWTPVILSDDIIVEVTIPQTGLAELELELTHIGYGYRGFRAPVEEPKTTMSGSCNVDVICPEGDDWREEISTVGVISTGGSTFCTGFMVNNTAEDQTPYFMTAYHCGINSGNAASLVVYWNYENSTCRPPGSPQSGGPGDGSLSDFQTGSYFRASYSPSDMTLVELDDDPNPAWNVGFAGWDHSSADATSAVGIHHPNTDEKRISFEYDPTSTTSYLGESVPGDGTHVRITDWDLGTTEPGSSGSPLFDQNHHVVGQLHGGYASCTSQTSDWYGRFSVSWTGGGSSSNRLSNWLDPLGTGAVTVDTLAPWASGLKVTPGSGFIASGPVGGPFTPDQAVYVLENNSDTGINYEVTATEPWLTITNGTGFLASQATANVTIAINANADTLPTGFHTDTINFVNLTDHSGDTTRDATIEVGWMVAYSFNMDTDPGWTTQGQWAWGQPTGGGGEYGNPDPTGGHTGSNVYGYNLNGDYANNLSETHLTSTAIDCSSLTNTELKFWRWLNVEQPSYDHAYLRVSNNGSSWTTLWQNNAEITDASWTEMTFDIASIADGQSTLYLRWTMGSTDSSWRYSGWNIDDVTISGFSTGGNNDPVLTGPGVNPASGYYGTRFEYSVSYDDPDGNAPSLIQVNIDGADYDMTLESGTPASGTYGYATRDIDADVSHTYYFHAEDGQGGSARQPMAGTLSGPASFAPELFLTGTPGAGAWMTMEVWGAIDSLWAAAWSSQPGPHYVPVTGLFWDIGPGDLHMAKKIIAEPVHLDAYGYGTYDFKLPNNISSGIKYIQAGTKMNAYWGQTNRESFTIP